MPLFTLGQSKNNDPIVQQTELRKLRFGLYAQGSLGWLSPEQQKKYSRGSLGLGYGWGFDMEINFNNNTTLRTGINLSTFKAGLNYYNSDLTPYLMRPITFSMHLKIMLLGMVILLQRVIYISYIIGSTK